MSSYYINIANDGAGILTPTVRRGGTASSGGTTVTIPSGELFAGTTATSTKLIGLAIDASFRAFIDDFVSNPTASYYINIVDSPTDTFTPAIRRAGTASSGGTALTIPGAELFPGTSTTKLTGLAVGAMKRAILNDRAAGN
tara:strand:+ start:352 stop:774 length:423 start_codon:yes stop_codon:yes gene_type:complete